MKLICSLLVTLGQCSPKRERGLNIAGVSSNSDSWRPGKGHPGHPEGIPSTPCANRGIQTVENVDNNDNGKLTIDHYEGDLHCYVEIGSKCNSDGVEVEFTDMTIENSWDYEHQYGYKIDNYVYTGCYDSVHFAYMSNGNQIETEGQCGCLHRSHPSCNYYAMYTSPHYTEYFQNSVTDKPSKHDLIGTNIKLILGTDYVNTGKFTVEWKCRGGLATSSSNSSSNSSPSNTIEMAETVLTGAFTPSMATDYGCAGRGFFDPFAPTIGSHRNDIDGSFFEWKKCVQCATGNDMSAISSYSYNVNEDFCGKLLFFLIFFKFETQIIFSGW